MSKFYEGQKVVCINDYFPLRNTTEEDKSQIGKVPTIHPQLGETLIIDEMLGDDMLRFDKYDTDAFNWWRAKHFKPLDEFEITTSSKIEKQQCDILNVAKMTRDDVVPYYASLIKNEATPTEIITMNQTILSKWSNSGLKYIKVKAWRSLGYRCS